ncbi:hypothetical protein AAG906_003218 [Vitis piasezkii]
MHVDPLEQELDVQDHQVWHKDANGLRLKPFPHFDDLSLVLVKILDQGEANNDIGVDDLEVKSMPLILIHCIHSK